jgi:hypothetical protein
MPNRSAEPPEAINYAKAKPKRGDVCATRAQDLEEQQSDTNEGQEIRKQAVSSLLCRVTTGAPKASPGRTKRAVREAVRPEANPDPLVENLLRD